MTREQSDALEALRLASLSDMSRARAIDLLERYHAVAERTTAPDYWSLPERERDRLSEYLDRRLTRLVDACRVPWRPEPPGGAH